MAIHFEERVLVITLSALYGIRLLKYSESIFDEHYTNKIELPVYSLN